jgi:hypothetical protein
LQATNLSFVNLPKDGVRVLFVGGTLTLMNCGLTPEQIKMYEAVVATPTPRVQAMEFLVASVKGAPPGAAVNVTTANPPKPIPKGAPDLNVRNAPATIGSAGLTPLPQTLKSLIVRSWQIEGNGQLTPAPQYNVIVTAPPEKPDADPKVLKSVPATPDAKWYRAKPNDPSPTMEITIP